VIESVIEKFIGLFITSGYKTPVILEVIRKKHTQYSKCWNYELYLTLYGPFLTVGKITRQRYKRTFYISDILFYFKTVWQNTDE